MNTLSINHCRLIVLFYVDPGLVPAGTYCSLEDCLPFPAVNTFQSQACKAAYICCAPSNRLEQQMTYITALGAHCTHTALHTRLKIRDTATIWSQQIDLTFKR